MTHWYDNDKLWNDLENFLFSPDKKLKTFNEVEGILDLLNAPVDSKILDLCCGTGRHTVEFARRGYKVTGVDRTECYLKKARKTAEVYDLQVEFINDDMRNYKKINGFDFIINYYTSFGFFEDTEEELTCLKNMYESLRSGGKLLMEMMGKEVLAQVFVKRHWHEYDDMIMIEEQKIRDHWKWVDMNWKLLKKGKVRDICFSMRLYSAVELETLLNLAGFSTCRFFGSIEGTPYDENAERMIVVAEK